MTMHSERCDFTDLLVDQCAHCRERLRSSRPPFRALYDGVCPTCGASFAPGTLIREMPTGEYEHAAHGSAGAWQEGP